VQLFSRRLFVHCRNPKACGGVIYLGQGRRWTRSTQMGATMRSVAYCDNDNNMNIILIYCVSYRRY
jgi:hypothetical protein